MFYADLSYILLSSCRLCDIVSILLGTHFSTILPRRLTLDLRSDIGRKAFFSVHLLALFWYLRYGLWIFARVLYRVTGLRVVYRDDFLLFGVHRSLSLSTGR